MQILSSLLSVTMFHCSNSNTETTAHVFYKTLIATSIWIVVGSWVLKSIFLFCFDLSACLRLEYLAGGNSIETLPLSDCL